MESQTQKNSQQSGQEAMMMNMMPGKVHEMMAQSAGDWTAEITYWTDPNQPPAKNTAKVYNEMIMDGRYHVSRYRGTFMDMPFEGMGITAYDNGTKRFYNMWIDNMSTGMISLEGGWKEENKSIELKGKSNDPMTGQEMMVRQVMTFENDNLQFTEIYMIKDGKETKSMEIRLTR